MSELVKCPDCAELIQPDARICRYCKCAVSSPESTQTPETKPRPVATQEAPQQQTPELVDCKFCGEDIKISAKVCRFCGGDQAANYVDPRKKARQAEEDLLIAVENADFAQALSLLKPQQQTAYQAEFERRKKTTGTAYLYFFLLAGPVFGSHKFYLRQPGWGIAYLAVPFLVLILTVLAILGGMSFLTIKDNLAGGFGLGCLILGGLFSLGWLILRAFDLFTLPQQVAGVNDQIRLDILCEIVGIDRKAASPAAKAVPTRKAGSSDATLWACLAAAVLVAVGGIFIAQKYSSQMTASSSLPPSTAGSNSEVAPSAQLAAISTSALGPDALIRELYKVHTEGGGIISSDLATNKRNLPKYFDEKLARMLTRTFAGGQIEVDPLTDSEQPGGFTNFLVAPPKNNHKGASVSVTFDNFGSPDHKIFQLHKTTNGWRISNVYDADGSEWIKTYGNTTSFTSSTSVASAEDQRPSPTPTPTPHPTPSAMPNIPNPFVAPSTAPNPHSSPSPVEEMPHIGSPTIAPMPRAGAGDDSTRTSGPAQAPISVASDSAGRSSVTATKTEVDFGPYLEDLQRRIKRAWFPPKGNESKVVKVVFHVAKDGQMTKLRILISSSVQIADSAAIKAVENASPFKALPNGAPDDGADIEFTFDYNGFNGGGHGVFRQF